MILRALTQQGAISRSLSAISSRNTPMMPTLSRKYEQLVAKPIEWALTCLRPKAPLRSHLKCES